MSIRVVVADDQDLVRTGLVMILGAQPGIDVVGEAAEEDGGGAGLRVGDRESAQGDLDVG